MTTSLNSIGLAVLGLALTLAGCQPSVESGVTPRGIYFESVGRGMPVVLLHAFSVDRRMWDRQVELLRDDYRVIRYDQRGHGPSAPPTEPFEPHLDLLEVFEAAELDKAVLVGLSAGSEIAINFALAFPDRVGGLVLASPGLSGYVPQGSFAWMSAVGEALQRGDVALAAERWAETPLMAIDEPVADSVMRALVRDNSAVWSYPQGLRIPFEPAARNRLAELIQPTIVIVGSKDLDDTKSVASLIVENAPNASLHMVPGVGHMVNMAAPGAFNEVLLQFLHSLR